MSNILGQHGALTVDQSLDSSLIQVGGGEARLSPTHLFPAGAKY